MPALLIGLATAQAQIPAGSAPQPAIEQQRQQERERALRARQEPEVDVRSPAPIPDASARLPIGETPCFTIERIVLQGESAEWFGWSLTRIAGEDGADSPIGRCLGAQGIDTVVARAQRAIVERGYLTTRILAAPQNLSGGVLTLTVVPGRIVTVRLAQGGSVSTSLRHAIPARPGDLLALRDIEQGLENLKRLPSAEADIQIAPSTAPDARPGDSDLVVAYNRKSPLRGLLSLDDAGTRATGRTQVGATLAWDGPLGLNDLAYVSLGHDAFNHDDRASASRTVHYSIPFGYTLLSATGSDSRYRQTVAGLDQDYVYSGTTRNMELRLARLVRRDRDGKTTVALRGFRRASTNFYAEGGLDNEATLGVQSHVAAGWEASLNHREFLGAITLDATLAWRRGTGAFGAAAAPQQAFGEGTTRMKLWTAQGSLSLPFQLCASRLRYTVLGRAQWNRTPLLPQDQFAIGGRFTVRGFDGETSLLGDRGGLLRNDLSLALGSSGAELYASIDYGQVSGSEAVLKTLLGHHLVGAALGVRGAVAGLNYDVFVGTPVRKPEGFRAARTTGGLHFNYSF